MPSLFPKGDRQQLLSEFEDTTDCWDGDLISKLHSLPLPDEGCGFPSTGDIGAATGMDTFWLVLYEVRRLKQLGRAWPKHEEEDSGIYPGFNPFHFVSSSRILEMHGKWKGVRYWS